MKKKVLITSGIIVFLVGAGYFTYKVIKEAKRQILETQEANEKEKEYLKEQLESKNIELEIMEENLQQAINADVLEDPDLFYKNDNPELEEMRMRQHVYSNTDKVNDFVKSAMDKMTGLAPNEEDYHAGYQQTVDEEKTIHHNVWEENEYFNTGEADIPYYVVQSAKDLKGNEGQSMRHDTDPNSIQAWENYKAVMISELYDDGPTIANNTSTRYNLGILVTTSNIDAIIDRFSELLEVNDTKIVQPFNEWDNNVFEEVYERRIDTFGPDTYYSSTQFPVTFGEILYEYAHLFTEDTTDGSLLAMVTYMMHEAGLLDVETIEQRLLIIAKIMEHRNVQDLANGMKKIGMFGKVVPKLSLDDTGHDVRLFDEYNEFLSRATTFEEEYMHTYDDEYDD